MPILISSAIFGVLKSLRARRAACSIEVVLFWKVLLTFNTRLVTFFVQNVCIFQQLCVVFQTAPVPGLRPRSVELATVWNIRIAGVNLAGLFLRSYCLLVALCRLRCSPSRCFAPVIIIIICQSFVSEQHCLAGSAQAKLQKICSIE